MQQKHGGRNFYESKLKLHNFQNKSELFMNAFEN